MAATVLNISPFYLPWHQQGIDFLLQDSAVPEQHSLCHAKSLHPMPKPKMAQHNQHYEAQKARVQNSTPAAQHYGEQKTTTHQVTKSGTNFTSNQKIAAQTHTAAPAQITAPAKSNRVSVPMEQWPHTWQERFRQTKPARVVWTYDTLGHDLCGQASNTRRELLRDILKDLGHPSGTHSFWPISLPDGNEPQNLITNVPVFWAGVRQLEARVLIVLGQSAATTLGYQAYDAPFKEFKSQDKLVFLTRDIETLIKKDHSYTLIIQYLRSHLRQYLQLR